LQRLARSEDIVHSFLALPVAMSASGSSARGENSRNGIDYTVILPVLFLEYLAVSIARSLIPTMIVEEFGSYSYLFVGVVETVKGLLAFVSSPLFGKLSDLIGRKYCLLATVIGTTAPIFLMVFTTNMYDDDVDSEAIIVYLTPPLNTITHITHLNPLCLCLYIYIYI
jgi:MFS family permease